MYRWIIVCVITLAMASPGWAKPNPQPNSPNGNNGKAIGQSNDGNPVYKLSPAIDNVQNSNNVLIDNPNDNVCGKSPLAAPGRNPHCPMSPE
jgi:hypothetical protein